MLHQRSSVFISGRFCSALANMSVHQRSALPQATLSIAFGEKGAIAWFCISVHQCSSAVGFVLHQCSSVFISGR